MFVDLYEKNLFGMTRFMSRELGAYLPKMFKSALFGAATPEINRAGVEFI